LTNPQKYVDNKKLKLSHLRKIVDANIRKMSNLQK